VSSLTKPGLWTNVTRSGSLADHTLDGRARCVIAFAHVDLVERDLAQLRPNIVLKLIEGLARQVRVGNSQCVTGDLVGSKNSNLLNDPDFTTEMLAD
jgi:hypothetical protein